MSFKSNTLTTLMVSALCLSGCGADNPGTWPADQVETQVLKGANLTEITLSPGAEPGLLTGSGKDASGETYQITVKQDADAKQINWEAKGDRGSTLDGLYGH